MSTTTSAGKRVGHEAHRKDRAANERSHISRCLDRDPGDVTQETIRMRAYEIFCGRIGGPGDAVSDWLQAERELRDELYRVRADAQGLHPIERERPLVENRTKPFRRGDSPLRSTE